MNTMWARRGGATLIAVLLFLVSIPGAVWAALPAKGDTVSGLGKVTDAWNRDLYPRVEWQQILSSNSAGPQVASIAEFSYPDTEIEAVASFGDSIYGGERLSSIVRAWESKGYRVISAINGDSYDTATGVPKGIVIDQGILHTYSPSYKESLGFTADRQVVFGPADLRTIVEIGGAEIPVYGLNKQRKQDQAGAYLLTRSFGPTTRSQTAGVEVVVEVSTKNFVGLQVGNSVSGKVVAVHTVGDKATGNTTPIGSGQIVLSTSKNSVHYKVLSKVKPGDSMKAYVRDRTESINWSQVKTAIGIYNVLTKNGEITDQKYSTNKDLHPRTSVAVTSKGQMHLMLNDGRRSGYAAGLTYMDLIDYYKKQGYVNVFNFDGGGSSTIYATMPGDETATLFNKPSDGRERSNANALLFVVKKPSETGAAKRLHLYQKDGVYRSDTTVVPGTQTSFVVKATGNAYLPVAVTKSDVTYSVQGDIGTIDKEGVFTASGSAKSGTVTVTHKNGATGQMKINLAGKIDNLQGNLREIALAPASVQQLSFTTNLNGTRLPISNQALTFELSNEKLGSITSDGVFTAGTEAGSGTLKVRIMDYTLEVPVVIGKSATLLNGFETSLEQSNWHWQFYNDKGARGGSAEASINNDAAYVKSGKGSLKIAYDFTQKPATGITACEVGPKAGTGKIQGQPSAIGMWIYGDNSGAWIRTQLAPSSYLGDIHVNWNGWKYVELPIPTDTPYPYELVWAVRMVTQPDSSTNHKKGVLYFDDVSLVYGHGEAGKPVVECAIERIAGENRYDTANRISAALAAKADTVLLANAEKYPDALVSAPLAGVVEGPILLTGSNTLPDATLAQLQSLGASRVILLGGEASIGAGVAETLKAKGFEVERIAGDNRYQTAVQLGGAVRAQEKTDHVYLASGENYPDALAVTSPAIQTNRPILMTGKSTLQADTKKALEDWEITQVTIVGGNATISADVQKELEAMDIKVTRIAGENRYATAVEIAKYAIDTPESAYIADGTNFVDALSAGPLAGNEGAPILLTQPKTLPKEVSRYLADEGIDDVIVVGGKNSVSEQVRTTLCEILE